MDTALAVRFLHVAAAVVLVGGASVLALAGRSDERPRLLSERYEWAAWVALLVLVATGIGNLAARGGLAPPGSAWDIAFTLKLVAVLLLAVVALARTMRVLLAADGAGVRRWLYGSTAGLGFIALGLAQVMAHG